MLSPIYHRFFKYFNFLTAILVGVSLYVFLKLSEDTKNYVIVDTFEGVNRFNPSVCFYEAVLEGETVENSILLQIPRDKCFQYKKGEVYRESYIPDWKLILYILSLTCFILDLCYFLILYL